MGASVYIVSAIFFIFFGTGNIQQWNFIEEDVENKNEKNASGNLKEMNEITLKNGIFKVIKETPLSVNT